MGSETISYGQAGTYTIIYPDGLFANVCRASDYYTETYTDDTPNYSGDNILLIPNNGSMIYEDKANVETTTIYTKYDRHGVATTTAYTDNSTINLGLFNHLLFPNNYQNIKRTYKKNYCKIISPYVIECGSTMATTKKRWEEQEKISRSFTKYNVTITIRGEPNYFNSNANFYYCSNNDETTPESEMSLYLASVFTGKSIVGGLVVKDVTNTVIDMGSVDLNGPIEMANFNNTTIANRRILEPMKIPFGNNAW